MLNIGLWELVKELKGEDYKWVDLSYELSPETPHWFGYPALSSEYVLDYSPDAPAEIAAPARASIYHVAGQYGTHVDAPSHFWDGARCLDSVFAKELVLPLVVVDKSAECAANAEYTMTVDDLKGWEEKYGRIPEGAFVAFRSDWHKKSDLDNPDENGKPHYPGWGLDAIKWLVEERNIGAIGHEAADTDPSYITTRTDAYPYPGEQYILSVDKFQIEVMRNLDQLPPKGALIVCAFPLVKDGTGFPARCFAVCPKD